jgi:DNA polymerase IV (DinB-like DNA polymerase)
MSLDKNKNSAEKRIIAHLDMDAFFAAIEERDNPRLKGWPIVVGADPQEGRGRGVVSTANYKAREYGIRSAVPISKAWELSQKAKKEGKPEAVFLDGHYKRYSEVSDRIMEIVRQYSKAVEQASVDEAYFELSDAGSYEKATDTCRRIKTEIQEKEKLTASIGIGPNKLIAKIASDMQKPDGLTVITPDKTEEFLELLSIRKIPGIGPKTEQFFNARGIRIVKDLKKYNLAEMEEMLGKWGEDLYYKIRGIDDSEIVEEYEAKSIGEQETFQTDTLDFNFVFTRMESLCQDVFRRFKESDFKSFRTVTITVRFSGFETKNRSHTLPKPANTLKTLTIESTRLLMPFFDTRENPRRKLIRLIGVRIEKLA